MQCELKKFKCIFFGSFLYSVQEMLPKKHHLFFPVFRDIPNVAPILGLDTQKGPEGKEHPVPFRTQMLHENVSGPMYCRGIELSE